MLKYLFFNTFALKSYFDIEGWIKHLLTTTL